MPFVCGNAVAQMLVLPTRQAGHPSAQASGGPQMMWVPTRRSQCGDTTAARGGAVDRRYPHSLRVV